MNDFTPDTEQVRSHYVFNQRDEWDAERGEAFDRWLAEVQADTWGKVCEAFAWCLANGPVEDALPYVAGHNPYREKDSPSPRGDERGGVRR